MKLWRRGRQKKQERPPPQEMTCEDCMEVLYEFLDGELKSTAQVSVREHLNACKDCYAYFHFEERFLDELKSAMSAGAPSEELRTRLLEMLDQVSADS